MKSNFYVLIIFLMYSCASKKQLDNIPSINVEVNKYGIYPNDDKEDGQRIINLLKQIKQSNGSKKVTLIFPSGNYLIEKSINIPSNVNIEGEGNVIFQRQLSKPYHLFIVGNANNSRISNVTVRGLRERYMSVPDDNNSYSYGIFINESNNIEISKVNISDVINTGMRISASSNITIDSCEFNEIGYSTRKSNGEKIKYAYDGIIVSGSKINGSSNIHITGCKFSGIGNRKLNDDGDGIQFSKNFPLNDIKISDCYFESCGSRGIKIQSGSNYTISDCTFSNCGKALGVPMSSPVKNVEFSMNVINNCSQGILINSSSNHCLEGITIRNNKFDLVNNVIYTAGASRLCGYNNSNTLTWSVFEDNVINNVKDFLILGNYENLKIKNNVFTNINIGHLKNNIEKPITFRSSSTNIIIENNRIEDGDSINEIVEKRKGTTNIVTAKNIFKKH